MASTYSDLKVELIGTGEQTGTWGTTTNNNFSVALGEAITGSADVTFTGADVTLTLTDTNAAQTARNLRLNLTGTSGGARNLILGSGCQIEKLYLINNGLADAVTVKNTTGTGIAVPPGTSMFVFNNGTNVVAAVTSVTTLTNSALTSGRVTYAGTNGLLQDSSNLTFNGTTLTANTIGAFTLGGTISGGGNQINNIVIGASTPLAGAFTTLSASGVATFSAGTVSAPAITTTGDTNTGIFFPAADTIAFTEGGVESMRIDSSGNVGVGTSSIGQRFVVNGASGVALQIENSSDSNRGGRLIATGSAASGTFGVNTTSSGYALTFGIDGTERMRVDTIGNVGIGTSSPAQLLDVRANATANIRMGSTGADLGNSTEIGTLEFFNSDANQNAVAAYVRAIRGGTFGSGGLLTFGTSETGSSAGTVTERMRINSSGNVGIGTNNPTATLYVKGGNTNNIIIDNGGEQYTELDFANNGTNKASFWWDNTNTLLRVGAGAAGSSVTFASAGAERMRIDSSGRLLLGTSTAGSNQGMTIYDATQGELRLQNSTTGNTTSDGFQLAVNGSNAFVYNRENAALLFGTNDTERMRITSGGDVGIGVQNPPVKLHIAKSGGCAFRIDDTSTNYWELRNDSNLIFDRGGTERMRITSGGNVGINNNNPSYTLAVNGSVYFSSTATTTYDAASNRTLGVFGASNDDSVNSGAVYNIEWLMSGSAGGQYWYANYITRGGARTLGAYCTGTNWTNASDVANKENIVPIKYGLETVMASNPVNFDWKSFKDENGKGKTDIGFIAQELETIIPEVVTGSDGNKGISYGNLVAIAFKAIQEQQAMIEELKAEVAALKAK